MEIRKIPIEKLNPATYNPRVDLQPEDKEYQEIKKSLEQFGYVDPIVWNECTGNVVGGHQRLKILIASGKTEIDCSVVNLSDIDEKALNTALNKIGGAWNEEKLAEILKELESLNYDISSLGFDSKEMDRLIDEAFREEIINDDFVINDVLKEENSITRIGDVWQLGRHKLICGDSTDETVIQQLMQNEKADLLLTDPPYNVDYHSKDKEKIKNDNLTDFDFYNFLLFSLSRAYEVLKPGGAFYIWYADGNNNIFRKVCNEIGLTVRQCIIWNKNHFTIGRQDYQWKHEPCLYGWKDGTTHYFTPLRNYTTVINDDCFDIDTLKKSELKNLLLKFMNLHTTVIDEPKPLKNEDHPTMKPIKLFGQLINNSTRQNEIVLDIFGGSGTTVIACEQLNRSARIVEYEPKYCDVIVKRYIKYSGNNNILLNGKEYKIN